LALCSTDGSAGDSRRWKQNLHNVQWARRSFGGYGFV
jgi:hypothetical protein